jgi:uracil-DNA glycosylase
MTDDQQISLITEIAGCRICAAHLPHGCRPVVRFSDTSRVLIIGQAPGTHVHESGVPWDDASGIQLRKWTGIGAAVFYDPAQVALVPMGFCYPGKGSGGDLPPRRECAPAWHSRILAVLPPDRMTLLVGSYAQARYLPGEKAVTLTQRVRAQDHLAAGKISLPHPSWRSAGWMKNNPWFEEETLPMLRDAVATQLAGR